jgi:hypothetical protein
VLLDLQGDLSITATLNGANLVDPNSGSEYSGSTLGTLTTEYGRPVLRIGQHMCEGKLVTLAKPLVITKKSKHIREDELPYVNDNRINSVDPNEPRLHIMAVVKQKLLFTIRPKAVVAQF